MLVLMSSRASQKKSYREALDSHMKGADSPLCNNQLSQNEDYLNERMQRLETFKLTSITQDLLDDELAGHVNQTYKFRCVRDTLLLCRSKAAPAVCLDSDHSCLLDNLGPTFKDEAKLLRASQARTSELLISTLADASLPFAEEDIRLALCHVERMYLPAKRALLTAAVRLRNGLDSKSVCVRLSPLFFGSR